MCPNKQNQQQQQNNIIDKSGNILNYVKLFVLHSKIKLFKYMLLL